MLRQSERFYFLSVIYSEKFRLFSLWRSISPRGNIFCPLYTGVRFRVSAFEVILGGFDQKSAGPKICVHFSLVSALEHVRFRQVFL